jgi:ribosomal protein S18 acetylase RimI-like enzyme
MFDYVEERLESPALELTYHLTPWDEPVFPGPTAAISSIRVKRELESADAFEIFRAWCMSAGVSLVSCRLFQGQLTECGFLEKQGFRFIELNYRPFRVGLGEFADDPDIEISEAAPEDAAEISAFAGRIFDTGRLHVDPQVGPEIGSRRYRIWAANAFRNPGQCVLKCRLEGRIVAFMVVEQPDPTTRFWSLVGLAPGLQGRGLGRRVWRAMLAFHRRDGVNAVSTSVSSHNTKVHNLYASLGFQFPAPTITLHWCPFGPLNASSAAGA